MQTLKAGLVYASAHSDEGTISSSINSKLSIESVSEELWSDYMKADLEIHCPLLAVPFVPSLIMRENVSDYKEIRGFPQRSI